MKITTMVLSSMMVFMCGSALAHGAEQEKTSTVAAAPLGPESKIVDKWRSTWDVKATQRHPQPAAVVTYTETFEWVLDGRFLRSETSRKSEGDKDSGKSMSMVWYDVITKSYRYVIFDAAGFAVEAPPPTWHEGTQTMEWTSSFFAPVSYKGHATFSDRDTIRWKSLLKDWTGTVVFDWQGVSLRRK